LPNKSWTHIEPEDAEVEDAAQLLAVILPNAVQVFTLPGRIRRKGISRGRPGNALRRQDPVRGLIEPQLLPAISDALHMATEHSINFRYCELALMCDDKPAEHLRMHGKAVAASVVLREPPSTVSGHFWMVINVFAQEGSAD
jgi:hypothetical protein